MVINYSIHNAEKYHEEKVFTALYDTWSNKTNTPGAPKLKELPALEALTKKYEKMHDNAGGRYVKWQLDDKEVDIVNEARERYNQILERQMQTLVNRK